MDPTRQERSDYAQEEQKQGIPGRGITSRSLGRIGRRIAVQTALRGFAALIANHLIVLIAIGVIAGIFIIVFVIVFAGGFGAVPGAPTLETTPPIVEPTETEVATPTPAEPESAL